MKTPPFDEIALKELNRASRVVLFFSGGADSVFLFHELLRREISFEALHFNHQLRGQESEGDEAFVRELCEEFAIKLHSKRLCPPENGVGIEAWAREQRYGFWFETLKEDPGSLGLTAHHQDDLIESLWLNFQRGCSWRGLLGIRKVDATRRLLRPLLGLSHQAIVQSLLDRGQGWREDSSNQDLRLRRNALRHSKELKEMEAGVKKRWENLAVGFQELEEKIIGLEEGFWRGVERTPGSFELQGADLLELQENPGLWHVLGWRYFGRALRRGRWIEQAQEILVGEKGSLSIDRGWTLHWEAPFLKLLSPRNEGEERQRVEFNLNESVSLKIGDKNYLLRSQSVEKVRQGGYECSPTFCTLLSIPHGVQSLTFRTRLPGDFFSPRNLNSRKRKLKKFFNESGFQDRDKMVVVALDSEVLWVPGYAVNDFYRENKNEKLIELNLYVQR